MQKSNQFSTPPKMEKNQLNFVSGDVELEVMIEGITEGKKGEEIAQVLDILVRQFDKL